MPQIRNHVAREQAPTFLAMAKLAPASVSGASIVHGNHNVTTISHVVDTTYYTIILVDETTSNSVKSKQQSMLPFLPACL